MDKDLDQAKGLIKQAVGDLTDDGSEEGKADARQPGKVKQFVGNAKDKADELIDRVRDKVTTARRVHCTPQLAGQPVPPAALVPQQLEK